MRAYWLLLWLPLSLSAYAGDAELAAIPAVPLVAEFAVIALPPPGNPLLLTEAAGVRLDAVLERERLAALQAQPSDPFAGYKQQTRFDNTPYRFNMKPGQKLSAAEFDAWMQARGIRIVRAKDEAPPAAVPATAAAAP